MSSEKRLLELGALTADRVLEIGSARHGSLRVMLATAWQIGLELGLSMGIDDVAAAREFRATLWEAVGHGPRERAEVIERARWLLGREGES